MRPDLTLNPKGLRLDLDLHPKYLMLDLTLNPKDLGLDLELKKMYCSILPLCPALGFLSFDCNS